MNIEPDKNCTYCIHRFKRNDEQPCRDCSEFDCWQPIELSVATSPLDVQVQGSHYKKLKIQPVEYIHANSIGFCEGSVIKYVTRWRDKGGINDLEKAKHFIDLLIELEKKSAA